MKMLASRFIKTTLFIMDSYNIAISQEEKIMNDESKLYLQRAENEFVAAQMLFAISSNISLQKEQFKLEKEFTFYSTVISHSYYCIFYSAKAILIKEGIKTEAPKVHMCYPFIISLRYNNSFHFIKPPLSSS